MRLTQFSDYSLRILLYLAAHKDRPVPLIEIAESYGISYHHLVKVSGMLVELGLVTTTRGRSGGFRLAADPRSVTVGWLIRRTEPDLDLVECFNPVTGTCPITPACSLKHVLMEAKQSFLAVLDRYTLADLSGTPARAEQLVQLWADRRAMAATSG